MKIILTGSTSFIGKAVAGRLAADGHELILFRHSYDESCERLPESADIWIHLAWAGVGSQGREDTAVQDYNVEMSLAALKKAMELKCRKFIFAGSQAEYGKAQDGGPKKETGCAEPVSAYGKAKLKFGRLAAGKVREHNEAENRETDTSTGSDPVIKESGNSGDTISGCGGMGFIHMRFFSVFGPGDHDKSLINTLIDDLRAGKEIRLSDCGQLWNYLYIDDAARAVSVLCASPEADGIYNIGSRDTRPLKDYVLEAAGIIAAEERGDGDDPGFSPGAAMEDTYVGTHRRAAGDLLVFGQRGSNAEGAADLSPDITKICRLGFEPEYSFGRGLTETLKERRL